MATTKYTIHAGEPMAGVLDGYQDLRSARVNQVCADWLAMVSELAPELTESEWSAVVDALNGMYPVPVDSSALRHAWAEIADAKDLGAKWGIDQMALAKRVRALMLPELLALAEVNRRFWSAADRLPPAESLRKAGARLISEADRRAEEPDTDAPEAGAAWFSRARPTVKRGG